MLFFYEWQPEIYPVLLYLFYILGKDSLTGLDITDGSCARSRIGTLPKKFSCCNPGDTCPFQDDDNDIFNPRILSTIGVRIYYHKVKIHALRCWARQSQAAYIKNHLSVSSSPQCSVGTK